MAQILDGKMVANKIKEEIKAEINNIKNKINKVPGLAVIIVGEDPASKIYVKNKKKDCEEVGIYSDVIELPENISEENLLDIVRNLNNREDIHGILAQLPLPKSISESVIINSISAKKDVDAFCAESVGKYVINDNNNYAFKPGTPAGVIELLKYYNIEIAGKDCVVIGRSNIVGKPQAILLLQENGTVTVCHSKTKNLEDYTKRADILVVAAGKRGLIKGDMIKDGAVIIDVGMHKDTATGKLFGDVNFAECESKASFITPVPGGVGPMTRVMMLKNTLTAAKFFWGV